jgi:hypothetical protein
MRTYSSRSVRPSKNRPATIVGIAELSLSPLVRVRPVPQSQSGSRTLNGWPSGTGLPQVTSAPLWKGSQGRVRPAGRPGARVAELRGPGRPHRRHPRRAGQCAADASLGARPCAGGRECQGAGARDHCDSHLRRPCIGDRAVRLSGSAAAISRGDRQRFRLLVPGRNPAARAASWWPGASAASHRHRPGIWSPGRCWWPGGIAAVNRPVSRLSHRRGGPNPPRARYQNTQASRQIGRPSRSGMA